MGGGYKFMCVRMSNHMCVCVCRGQRSMSSVSFNLSNLLLKQRLSVKVELAHQYS